MLDEKSVLFLVMDWQQIGNNPQPKPMMTSHRENHQSADRSLQNTRRTGKTDLYNHV